MCECIGLNISHLIQQAPTLKANMIQFDGLRDSQGKIVECVADSVCIVVSFKQILSDNRIEKQKHPVFLYDVCVCVCGLCL